MDKDFEHLYRKILTKKKPLIDFNGYLNLLYPLPDIDYNKFIDILKRYKVKMLNTQKFLRENGLEEITKQYAVKVKRHSKYPNLVLFVYDQISTPKNPITNECRGLILDEANDWTVVNYTYRRFANHGEGWADEIDWSTARVLEKLDGSLIQLYYYNGEWLVATKGTPEASGNVGDFGFTFEQLFWRIWKELNYDLPKDTRLCYAFEFCSKYNRVVVKHEKERLILHGARNIITLEEKLPDFIARKNNWECVKSYPLSDLNSVVAEAERINGVECEGFVIVDGAFNRLKIKSPKYVAVSHIRDGLDNFKLRRMLELIILGEAEETLAYYPEYRDLHDEVKGKYDGLLNEITNYYNEIKNIENQKEFALKAVSKKYSGALFAMRKGSGVSEYINKLPVNKVEELLGIKIHESMD